MKLYRDSATAPAPSWTGRTLLTVAALGIALVLVGARVPSFAYWTLILIALYLLLTNAGAAGRTINYLANPNS